MIKELEYIEYDDARAFLSATQPVLEKNEALFGLMLGISLRLVENPLHYGTQPFLATITDKKDIQLIALMTPPYKLQIASFCREPEKAVELLTANLRKGEWNVPAVLAEEEIAKCFASEWTKLTDCQSEHSMRQRIYQLRAVKHHDYPSGCFRRASAEDLSCAAKWMASFQKECFDSPITAEFTKTAQSMIENGHLYFWDDPLPVSMAAFTRPTKNGITVSYVYTPPEFRKKGYASAVVASLSSLALENGKQFCTLYTDLSNPTSNSIYQKIGYEFVAEVMDVNFEKD